jgi:hypothetical protein
VKLSETQLNHLNATFLFSTHHHPILDYYFPANELINLRTEPHTEHFCKNSYLLHNLQQHLPFGHFLTEPQWNFLVSGQNKLQIIKACHAQLLYWYLAQADTGPLQAPVTNLALYYETDHFWHDHIASQQTLITNLLLENHHLHFLQHFALSHTSIQLEIAELSLVSNPRLLSDLPTMRQSYTIVHQPGITYTIKWVLTQL